MRFINDYRLYYCHTERQEDLRMEYILKTNLLTKQFRQQKAVDGVSLQIERGAIYGLIGRNGAGKTTFLRMVAGLARPTSGEIELMGIPSTEKSIRSALNGSAVRSSSPAFTTL